MVKAFIDIIYELFHIIKQFFWNEIEKKVYILSKKFAYLLSRKVLFLKFAKITKNKEVNCDAW